MTVTLKRSRRLALLRSAAIVAALTIVASCDFLPPVDISGLDVTQVVVVPSSTSLEPQQPYQFAAYGRTTSGDSVAVAVVWSTTSGTISSSGQYVADSLEGDYEVRATLAGQTTNATVSSGSSLVRVRKLEQLVVTPPSATLPTGGIQAFAAYGRLRSGDSVAVTVSWSATGGSISPIGLYTAGQASGQYVVTAVGKSLSTMATITLTAVPVASLSVSPASATLSIGATQQLSAVMKDAAGNTLTGRVVTWSSSNATVATVSGSGVVTAAAAGSATITATSEGKDGTSIITVQATQPVSREGYYVAPNGSPTGDGSETRPWDLATALAHPVAVQPGDTVWLRGGTYRGSFSSSLRGTAAAPIILRQYPGERATIDVLSGSLNIYNSTYTWYWGFEVMSSAPPGADVQAIDNRGSNTKLINLVVHDAQGNGIGFWLPAVDAEIYGSIIYNNGRQIAIPGHAHGIYTQNDIGTKLISDNIIFHNLGFDFHAYSATQPLNNYIVDGNIGINTGGPHGTGGWLLQGDPSASVVFQNNRLYASRDGGIKLGPPIAGAVGRLSFLNNYFWGGVAQFGMWDLLTVTGNTLATRVLYLFAPASGFPVSPNYVFDRNTYWGSTAEVPPIVFRSWFAGVEQFETDLTGWRAATPYDDNSTLTTNASGKPTTNHIFVRPNKYEAGRANITIFNWQNLGSVAVDVSGVLSPGDQYQVRNVQNFFGTPSLSGTYTGGSISIPMAGVTPTAPLGGWPKGSPAITGPEFNAFVLLRTSP